MIWIGFTRMLRAKLACLWVGGLLWTCQAVAVGQEISLNTQSVAIQEDQVESIGGFWYVSKGEPKTYYYRDAGRWLDLFSYHCKDSNKDGIPNLQISHDQNHLIIKSQGYPNHPTAIFPNSDNPNTISVQDFTFRLPLIPRKSETITRLPMGPVGMSLNGVVFFNPFEMEGRNAVAGYDEVWLDSCCGHPQQTGVYHYHKYPTCVKSPFIDDGKSHSPIIGFAFDGYPLYGPYESDNKMAMELTGEQALDACNGHSDSSRGYHYHVTPSRFPYILGGYAGEVEPTNNREFRRNAGRMRTGPIEDNTQPGDKYGKIITSVRPGNLVQGKSHEIHIDFEPIQARRPIPEGAPTWLQIGPYEADSIQRTGNTVTAKITIPKDATVGVWLDCHMEFGSDRRPLVIKKNDAARVTSE
ncbi:MAG: YHYH protein [Pirellula sp.]